MAAFCGLHYDELKTVVTLSSIYPEGVNIREGIELETKLVRKLEVGQSAVFAGEVFRSRDGSVRIRLQDGSGFASIYSQEGTAFLSTPPTPAVETSTDSPTVYSVVLRVRNHRFLASYRSALKRLGFRVSTVTAGTTSNLFIFEHESDNGIDRARVNEAFEPLVQAHLKTFYAFPKPTFHRSEEWYRYELWQEYKKEISIFAD